MGNGIGAAVYGLPISCGIYPVTKNMATIKKPKDAGEAFVQKQTSMQKRFSEKDIGMGVGNALTNAVNLAMARLEREKAVLTTREDYQEEVKFWLDWLYKTAQEKKDYEAIPIIEEQTEAKRTPTDILETIEAAEAANHRTRTEEEREANELFDINLNQ